MRREIQKVEESLGAKGTSQKTNAIGHVREDESPTQGRAAGSVGRGEGRYASNGSETKLTGWSN